MDFYRIKTTTTKSGAIELSPEFTVTKSKDLMIRGKSFYAIWDEGLSGLWSTNEFDIQRIVDNELYEYQKALDPKGSGGSFVRSMRDFSSLSWTTFKKYTQSLPDSSIQLDENITFASTIVKKTDYVSKRLPYDLVKGEPNAWTELIGTLYDPGERAKLEWAIGAIVSGDAKSIQKFIVLYGEHGTGKSTVLNIIQKLFHGYYATFEAKALTSSNNQFSTEAFKTNPLVAIQHDGDLSRIEDNTKLNSIVSHEEMSIRELYKPSYTARFNCFLFMGTNKPVKITDGKSGIIRRLLDVRPTGKKLPPEKYQALYSQIDFELGAIAQHCLDVYHSMGKNYYSSYVPLNMIYQTDSFFNYVEENYFMFKHDDGVSLRQAFDMYKAYCEDAGLPYPLQKHKFRDELKNYFQSFNQMTRVDGKQIRNYYSGFLKEKFEIPEVLIEKHELPLVIDQRTSLLDQLLAGQPAQYATSSGNPLEKWDKVFTTLTEIHTNKLHWVKPPINHVVIDFDLKDDTGEKSLELNLKAASTWPPTYAELSKGGGGIHLHYIYDGDLTRISRLYAENIEIKVFTGNSSLRRKLTVCNSTPIATINSGLPLKGEKVVNFESVKSEKHLRAQIEKNLRKEIHSSTKPSIDFIHKILEEAYDSGMNYDVTDMRPDILVFANNSSNQPSICIKTVRGMKFKSEEPSASPNYEDDTRIVFFDVEVFPNLFLVNWKFAGSDNVVRMINPEPKEMESLLRMKLVGYNCRRYDNHMIYARYLGKSLAEIYELSQRIINNSSNAMFAEAYGLSYADIYEFSSVKQSLKKFEIELGSKYPHMKHQELGLPWDQPVPEELWIKVAEYCDNDVNWTEIVFNERKADFIARKIITKLSGLKVNDKTQNHAAKIIFGDDKNPQNKFIYTDLSKEFPGYTYSFGQSKYRDEDPSEGGYVHSEPGIYRDVALLDVESEHPWSAVIMEIFGPYTERYADLLKGRIAVKHKDTETIKTILEGALAEFLDMINSGEITFKDLSNALKIIINIVYGMTSAPYANPFKDPRNVDNIVAKRGALFMIDLKHAVQDQGFIAAHIKTDSIKIPNATPEIIEFVKEFGAKYGYKFEHEATYEKMALVNKAVYIAKYAMKDGLPFNEYADIEEKKTGKRPSIWTATGSQFAHPYVFKSLFSHEPITLDDMVETKQVKTSLHLDFNEGYPDVSIYEKELAKLLKSYEGREVLIEIDKDIKRLDTEIAKGHNYQFVGRIGAFCPIKPGEGGGLLMREKEGKYNSATGATGHRWKEVEIIRETKNIKSIDKSYFKNLCDKAYETIAKFGDYEAFVADTKPNVYSEAELPF